MVSSLVQASKMKPYMYTVETTLDQHSEMRPSKYAVYTL